MADCRIVLALDTATRVTVGVATGATYLGGDVVHDRMAHVEQLMPTVVGVLDRAGVTLGDVTDLVVGLGPGPFTGLRVGVVTAQILAGTLPARLHGICSLDVIAAQYAGAQHAGAQYAGAQRAGDEKAGAEHLGAEHAGVAEPAPTDRPAGEFVVATDARRREVYWARYRADGSRIDGPAVGRPDQLPDLPTVGPGVELYPELPASPGPRDLDPRTLALRGLSLPAAGATPLYLRRPDAAEPTRRKSVLLRRHHHTGHRR